MRASLIAVIIAVFVASAAAQSKPPAKAPRRAAAPAANAPLNPPPGDEQYLTALITAVPDKYQGISFLADRPLPMRESEAGNSKVIRTLRPLELAGILDIKPGMVLVTGGFDIDEDGRKNAKFTGWLHSNEDKTYGTFLIPRKMTAVGELLQKMNKKKWSIADKHAIVRKVPKVGFTVERLDAMGDADSTISEATAAGTVEVRTYGLTTATISNGKVTKVVTRK